MGRERERRVTENEGTGMHDAERRCFGVGKRDA
jgi:hypothetical protein